MSTDLSTRPGATQSLLGAPASPGVHCGTAVVFTASTRREDLHHGSVLIADGTSSGWVPLLQYASALVMTGGVLTNPATLAREIRVPAVVVDRQAIARIPAGASVIVDGDRGTVDIL